MKKIKDNMKLYSRDFLLSKLPKWSLSGEGSFSDDDEEDEEKIDETDK
ncbi:hypothetical protein HanPSC8_Chr01g0043951 [Helianthus annuus]|nr:hypothetical protein HanPSC8_Chr01g0043951 [Helianthus annuus]